MGPTFTFRSSWFRLRRVRVESSEPPSATREPPHSVSFNCLRCGSSFKFNTNDLAETETRTVKCPHCKKETTISVEAQKERAYQLGITRLREKDFIGAVKRFQEAAELGHPEAQGYLGICYMDGLGVEKDEAEAVKWVSQSAAQGVVYAEFLLGTAHYYGRGIPKEVRQSAGIRPHP